MQAADVPRAIAAALSSASAFGLTVDAAMVLQDSNRLVVRLLPADVVARVAPVVHQPGAAFEVALAHRLANTTSPVAALEPRVGPRVSIRDGFVVTLWAYYAPVPQAVAPATYARALAQLHAGMRHIDVTTPHFTDRVAEAQRLVENHDRTPALADADRELLSNTLRRLTRAIADRGAAEQVLHGEPHPGNVLNTQQGLRFVDLETCCRGPVEFDIAHMPAAVSNYFPEADQELVRMCRILMRAMVAAWRWDRDDQFPNGRRAGVELLSDLRAALENDGGDAAR